MGVQVIEFDGGLIAEAVFQTHFGKVVAFEAEADVLVAGVGAFGCGQDVGRILVSDKSLPSQKPSDSII